VKNKRFETQKLAASANMVLPKAGGMYKVERFFIFFRKNIFLFAE
jgi:hypothetical protein